MTPGQVLRRLPALLIGLGWLAGIPARADIDYRLGHGLDIGPFNFGGYASFNAFLPNQGGQSFRVGDLSLYATGHLARYFNPFVEIELTRSDFVHRDAPSGRQDSASIMLERVYNDAYLTDQVTVRLGKMLTPVGRWNEIHAAPLVLTAVRPAVTYRNFSEYVTGGAILYKDPVNDFVEGKLYWQPTKELSERPVTLTNHQYRSVGGAQLAFPIGLLDRIGVSFQHSRDSEGFSQSLLGADYHYTVGRWTLEGEATVSDVAPGGRPGARRTEWGGYAAASYALDEQWSIYGWYEGFADRMASSTAHDLLAGVGYRPIEAVLLRVEYVHNIGGQPVTPSGAMASIAILF